MLPPLWKQGAQKRWSAKTSAPSRNILPPRWFSILCYFCTVQFKAGLQCSSLPNQRKAVPTVYNLPAAQGPLLCELWADGNVNAMGSKAHCRGSSSCARHTMLAQAPCPKLPNPGVCVHTAQSVGRETSTSLWYTECTCTPTAWLHFSSAPNSVPAVTPPLLHNSECFQEQTCKHTFAFCTWIGKKEKFAQKKIPWNKMFGIWDTLSGFISSETGVLKSTLRNIFLLF